MHENSPSPRRRMPGAGRGLAALAAAGLACTAGLAAGSPAQAGTRAQSATIASSALTAVSADSATDAWSVGYVNTTTGKTSSLTLHWNGTSWGKVNSPDPSGARTVLNGVSAVSPTQAWAVGSNHSAMLILQWNGTKWAQVPAPTLTGSANSYLTSVSADSATDAWAVGVNNTSGGTQQAVVLHWDGTSWSQVTAPPSGVTLGQVKALSPTDVWAGGEGSTAGSGEQAMVLQWDGTSWTQTTLPEPSGGVNSSVNAIGASSDSNVWAVGTYLTTNEEEGTASWHLSGSTWSAVTVPTGAPQGTPDDDLMGVATLGANGGWAVGWDPSPPGNSTTTQALRWNGTTWTQASTPITPAGDTDHLVAVAALSGSSAWAVGSYNNSVNGGKTGTYVLHWTGKTWKRSESPN